MQFTKGNFVALRATTKIHLGQIGEDILEDDVIEFDGQTLKMSGHEHKLSALKGAIKAGWFVPATDTTSKYVPKPAGVRIKTSLTQEDENAERAEMSVSTINDEERVVGTIKTTEQVTNAEMEDQGAVSVGTIKTQAKQKVNLADAQAVQKELSRLEKPVPRAEITKTAQATGDVQEAIEGDTLTELLPDAAVPESPNELVWDMTGHWRTRVKNAKALYETNRAQFDYVLSVESDTVVKNIKKELKID